MTELRLGWDANAEPNIAGYKIYPSRTSGVYGAIPPKDMGNVTTGGVDYDESGVWFFSLTAYNVAGFESEHSNEVSRNLALGLSPGKAN